MTQKSGAKKWLLAIGIALVFTMFINYGIRTFYEGPNFDEYKPEDCPEGRYPLATEEKETYRAECDEWENNEFIEIKDKYETNVFIILVVAGLIGIILGLTLVVDAVSLGLLLGGIITLFIGTIRYWGRLFDYARFVILGAVLALLIWLGYKKLK
ncbi:hypothetical protein ACFLZ7_03790 [Nanoarchaeota archaeon]